MLTTWIRLVAAVWIAGLLTASSCEDDKCEGDGRDEVIASLDQLQVEAFNCGWNYAGDFSGLLACVELATRSASARRDAMSKPCRKLFDDLVEALSVGNPDGGGTMCHGDVCCDSSGCVGG